MLYFKFNNCDITQFKRTVIELQSKGNSAASAYEFVVGTQYVFFQYIYLSEVLITKIPILVMNLIVQCYFLRAQSQFYSKIIIIFYYLNTTSLVPSGSSKNRTFIGSIYQLYSTYLSLVAERQWMENGDGGGLVDVEHLGF